MTNPKSVFGSMGATLLFERLKYKRFAWKHVESQYVWYNSVCKGYLRNKGSETLYGRPLFTDTFKFKFFYKINTISSSFSFWVGYQCKNYLKVKFSRENSSIQGLKSIKPLFVQAPSSKDSNSTIGTMHRKWRKSFKDVYPVRFL